MFLPWIGLFEQVRLADVYVHYDDVQLPQGRSFANRVQIKLANGTTWLTAPLDHANSGTSINDVAFFDGTNWRSKHLETLRHAYARAPYFDIMFALAREIFDDRTSMLSEFNIRSTERIARWLGLTPQFFRSSEMNVPGASTDRLVALCERTQCSIYVTGHGALKYLNYQSFEDRDISVRYIDYRKVPYRQGSGDFTPYVSILDAIAHCGERTRELLCSEAVYWKDFEAGFSQNRQKP
jgi:hypothetical protein